MAWIIAEGELTNTDFIGLIEKPMSKSYPKAYWRIDPNVNDSQPYHELLPVDSASGAFMNAASLRYVSIPQSVKKIGELAFAGTALKKVKIAPDCEYYPTSFPEDCVISFYGDEIPLPDLHTQFAALVQRVSELEEKLLMEEVL